MTVKTLLDFIGQHESGRNYNIVWGGIKSAHKPPKPLVSMTVQEVLDWQDSIDRLYMSEAAGFYQIMEDTLRGLYRSAGVPLSQKFDEHTQDKLAVALLRRRGLDDYLAGRISPEKFAHNLSKEWASLPAIFKDKQGRRAVGQSYYAGDGLNKSHATIDDTLEAVRSVKDTPAPDPRESPTQSKTVKASAVTAAVGASGGAFGALGNLDPVAQYILLGGGVLVALLGLYIMRDRLRKWAEGVR